MADVRIEVTRNGSYHVLGPVTVVDHKGNEVVLDGEDIWLCRCGHSETKPFCDGSHRRVGFKGPIADSVEMRVKEEPAAE